MLECDTGSVLDCDTGCLCGAEGAGSELEFDTGSVLDCDPGLYPPQNLNAEGSALSL